MALVGIRRPLFTFCGSFKGRHGESGPAWLKKFEYEHESYLPPGVTIPARIYLETVQMLLIEHAAVWTEMTVEILHLFSLRSPTQDHVARFKQLFLAQYPHITSLYTFVPPNVMMEVEHLAQDRFESLTSYHKRTQSILQRAGGRDRPKNNMVFGTTESALLWFVMQAFATGIYNPKLREEAIKDLHMATGGLAELYRLVNNMAGFGSFDGIFG
ncbi:MAG: hypothetical protein MMC33_002759 [Icmadophila ericetorum]|nr:hypothetical protein [Icmadophila ericetorum]